MSVYRFGVDPSEIMTSREPKNIKYSNRVDRVAQLAEDNGLAKSKGRRFDFQRWPGIFIIYPVWIQINTKNIIKDKIKIMKTI